MRLESCACKTIFFYLNLADYQNKPPPYQIKIVKLELKANAMVYNQLHIHLSLYVNSSIFITNFFITRPALIERTINTFAAVIVIITHY